MKNPELKVAVWGAPMSDSQYRLVILTSEGIQRITANIIAFEE